MDSLPERIKARLTDAEIALVRKRAMVAARAKDLADKDVALRAKEQPNHG